MQQAATDTEITPIQCQALELLLSNHSPAEAAKIVNVDRITVYRWRQEPSFRRALADGQQRLLEEATARLIGLQMTAIDTIDQIRKEGSNSDATKLKAAQFIVQVTLEMHQNAMAQQRIAALEELISSQD